MMAYPDQEDFGSAVCAESVDSNEQFMRELAALAGCAPDSFEAQPGGTYGDQARRSHDNEPRYSSPQPIEPPVPALPDNDSSATPKPRRTLTPAEARALRERAFQDGYQQHKTERAERSTRRQISGLVLGMVLVVTPGVVAGSRVVMEGQVGVPVVTRFVDGGLMGYIEAPETFSWLYDTLRGKPHPTVTELEQQRNQQRLQKDSSTKK